MDENRTYDIENLPQELFELTSAGADEQEKISRPSQTFWQDAFKRLVNNKGARTAFILIFIISLLAVIGPALSSHTFKEQIAPIASHSKLPPRIPIIEKLGIFDGARTLTVGENGLAKYKEGEYKLLKELTIVDEYTGEERTQYKIKEFTYIVKGVPDEYYIFGTDDLGRDEWVRTWKGAQISLIIGLIAALFDFLIGVTYGSIAGYFGGKIDLVMMRFIEIISGIPYMVIIIIFKLYFDKLELPNSTFYHILPLTLAIGITGWISMARVVRSQFMKLKNQEFVIAAKTIGASDRRMIWKHFIPNILGQIIIMITFTIPSAIFYEAFLAFIGMGIPAPEASLGVLINEGYKLMKTTTYLMVIPSIVICVLILALNLFANGLRDALDPKMRNM